MSRHRHKGDNAFDNEEGDTREEYRNDSNIAGEKYMIDKFIEETCNLLQGLNREAIMGAKDILIDCYRNRKRVFTMGNGGSASTAQHFACDLAKYVIPNDDPPFNVTCLTDNMALYTAWANDADRDYVFVNLMKGLLKKEDVLILASVHGGTGFSNDLVKALEYAKKVGAKTISLVGFDGGILGTKSTCSIIVPINSTPYTEAIHLVIEHLLMFMIKTELRQSVNE